MELDKSGSPISDYTTNLQSSKEYGTAPLKQKCISIDQDRKPRNKPRHLINYSMTKEARTYNGGKTDQSISGTGETGQLHIQQ